MKKSITGIIFVIVLSASSLFAKSWIVLVENNDYVPVTIQSNDPSARNNILDKAGIWRAQYKNIITVEPGQHLALNDFVIGWTTHGSKVTIKTSRGEYILQEDRNMVFETFIDNSSNIGLPEASGSGRSYENRVLERGDLQDRTVKLIINSDGTLTTVPTS